MKLTIRLSIIFFLASLLLAGCTKLVFYPLDGGGMERLPYIKIDQQQARLMMEADDGHVVVDVRRQDEYDAGHIPGAILIPNETIGAEPPEALPDRSQIILIYCRSGNRSKQAAEKLGKMGYFNVYEFGGIIDWTGDVVTTEEEQAMEREKQDALADAIRPVPTLVIEANGRTFYVTPADNPSAKALIEQLSHGQIELELHDYGSFEKVGPLPWDLPRSDEDITTAPGDVILYQGNQITLYYDENTWNFTHLGRIEGATREGLLSVLGEGSVTVKLWVEWSE